MRHPRSRRLAAVALAAVLMATAACSDGDADDRAEFESTDDTSPAPTDDGVDGAATVTGEGAAIGVSFPDPDDVVAEATFPAPNHPGEEIRIGVESIIVTEQTMELRLVITPLFDEGPVSVLDLLENGTGVVPGTLIDRVNLKEYVVLTDGPNRYETNGRLVEAVEGQTVAFQRFFAPPEDDIDVIDVKVHDALPVFEDVPLTFED